MGPDTGRHLLLSKRTEKSFFSHPELLRPIVGRHAHSVQFRHDGCTSYWGSASLAIYAPSGKRHSDCLQSSSVLCTPRNPVIN